MPNGLLPNHQATPANPENTEVEVSAQEQKDDVSSIAAKLQEQADAEAAANKAAIENPELSEEEAEAIGKAKAAKKEVAEKKEGEADPAAAGEEKPEKAAAEEKYVPNVKYKVLDQEKEIPEWAAKSMTKENEAEIRELFEKAEGLPHVKQKLQEERTVRETLGRDLQEVQQVVKNTMGWRDKNLGIFFEKLGVSDQQIAQYMLQKIQMQELPEHVRKMYNDHEAQQRRLAELEQENSQLSTRVDVDMVQARTNELNQVLSSPEVSQIVSAFDGRVGKPGSFAQTVIRHAAAEWEASGKSKELSPKEAVDEVLKILNLQPSQTPGQAVTPNETPNNPAPKPTQKVVKQTKPVVLPNVGGGGNAPAAKRVKSVDDIRKAYRQMSGQN